MAWALYNTERKELIGVFSDIELLSKYIFGVGISKSKTKGLYTYAQQKMKIKNNILGVTVCLRHANQLQLQMISETSVFIAQGYPEISNIFSMKFTSTQGSLYKDHVINHHNKII